MAYLAADVPATQPWPTALATCHGLPVTSPHAKRPGTSVAHEASTFTESSISGIAPRSMARSADERAPSSMNTPSVSITVPSDSSIPVTRSSPSMRTGIAATISAPASAALRTAASEARTPSQTQ